MPTNETSLPLTCTTYSGSNHGPSALAFFYRFFTVVRVVRFVVVRLVVVRVFEVGRVVTLLGVVEAEVAGARSITVLAGSSDASQTRPIEKQRESLVSFGLIRNCVTRPDHGAPVAPFPGSIAPYIARGSSSRTCTTFSFG